MKVVGYDKWSDLGVMADLLDDRGTIETGIWKEATMEEVIHNKRRRKRHKRAVLNEIEEELVAIREKQSNEVEDVNMWTWNSGFKPKYSTLET